MATQTNLNPVTAILNNIATDCTTIQSTIYFNEATSYEYDYLWFLSNADILGGDDFGDGVLDFTLTKDAEKFYSPLTEGGLYHIKTWLIPVYNELTGYVAQDLVVYDGILYECVVAGPTTETPGEGTDWLNISILSPTLLYSQMLTYITTKIITGYVQGEIELECPICDPNDVDAPFSESTCHEWVFFDADHSMTVTITDITGATTYLDAQVVEAGESYTFDSVTGGNGDGAYIVTITSNEVTTYYYVFDICGVRTCIKTLILALLCNEQDSCCDSCNPETKAQLELYRLELNKISLILFELMMTINSFRIEYMGWNEEPTVAITAQLTYINSLITKLKHLITRCGDCGNSGNSTPCNC